LSRFRSELTEKKAFDRILKKINRQLVDHKVIIRNGAGIIDATLTDTPRCPKGKTVYELAEDRQEYQRDAKEVEKEEIQMKAIKKQQPGVDNEARYLKKGKKLHFGYKRHVLTDENGIQLSVHTTTANEHDSKGLKPCLKNQDKKLAVTECHTDKGYQVPDNKSLNQ
jgi:IS5 family transposase